MKNTATTSFKIIMEILLGFVLLICIACGFVAWKLSQGPISLDKAVPYLVDYFNDTNEETIQIDTLILKWSGFENPLGLTATNVVVSNDRGPFIFSPEVDLNLNISALFIGQFDIETVWIRQIVLSVTKGENGGFTITGQPLSDETRKSPDVIPAELTLTNLINDLPDLDYFWIDEARLIYRDKKLNRTKMFEPVTLYIENNKEKDDNQRKLSGFLSFPFGEDMDSNVVQLNFDTTYDPATLNIYGSFEQTPLSNFLQFAPPLPEGLDISMVVDADIQAQLDDNWQLHAMDADITAPSGKITYPLNDTTDTINFEDLKLAATHSPKSDILDIKEFSALLNGEVPLSLIGQIQSINDPDFLSGAFDLTVTDLPQEYFDRYWPADYRDNGAYKWLTQKMDDGTFPSIAFTTRFDTTKDTREDGKPLPPWLISAKAEFSYDDMTIDYNAPMAKATNTQGTGVYDDIELTLDIDESDIGGMTTTNATLHFDDLLTRGEGTAKMIFPVRAQAQEVFDYIAAKPISAFKNIDFQPVNTKGDVEAVINITLPLIKDLPMEKIVVTVDGTVTDGIIPNAVKDLTLAGGPYKFSATTEDIQVSGSGRLAGQPITLDWHEYFSSQPRADYLSKINATVAANDTIRQAFIDDIASHFEGSTQIKLDYLKQKNGRDTAIDLSLDLSDTAITFNEIGLNKEAGEKVTATLDVGLTNGNLASIDNLKIKGDALSLTNANLTFKTENDEPAVTNALVENVKYGNNNLSVLMAQENDVLKTNITGSYIDITSFLKGQKDDIEDAKNEARTTSRAIELGIVVDQMQTAENATLKQPKLYARLNSKSQIERFELDANLGNSPEAGELYLRYTPDVADGLSLRVESNNAGGLFRAFDLYPYIRGGNLQIAGKPVKGGRFGDVQGKARIDNFEVINAPVVLRLLNALSFQNFMQAGSLGFSRLESDFEWRLGEDGDTYTIHNGRTYGSAVALTFDGYINNASNDMRVTGTAAPLSSLNKMIGNIPIVGQILTGGDALVAATYTVSGDPEDPEVSVNPLSVLAPGIIRKMLFENNPTPDRKEEAQEERDLN